MAAAGAATGVVIGSFGDDSSKQQKSFVQYITKGEHNINIYSEKIYIGLTKLPANGSNKTEDPSSETG